MNTTALTDLFLSVFFLHFCFFGFLLCPVFGGSFFERNEKQKKTNFETKQQKQIRKKNHKMQTRRPLSLVTKTTQKQNYTSAFFKMETNNTRKTNKNKFIKHKKPNYPFNNQHSSKTPELQGTNFFIY